MTWWRRLRTWTAERRRRRQRRDLRTRLLMAWVRIDELRYQIGIERRRSAELLIRLGRQQERQEGLREISEAAALASRLFEPAAAAGDGQADPP